MSRFINSLKIIILFFIANTLLFANDLVDYDENYKFGLGFAFNNKSSFYDFDGKDNTRIGKLKKITFFSENGDSSVTLPGVQTFEFSELHTFVYSEFKLNDDFIAELNLDIANYNFISDFTYQDSARNEDGEFVKDPYGNVVSTSKMISDDEYSRFQFQYINTILSYYLINTEDKLRLQLGIQVPFSFDSRTKLNDSIFLDDGYFRLDLNSLYRVKFETTMIQAGIGYSFRNEINTDLFNVNLGIFFNKIQNTRMYVIAEYNESLNKKNKQNFVLTEFETNESYLNTNFGLDIRVEEFELKLSYTYVPWGKSYYVRNNVMASFHYYLK